MDTSSSVGGIQGASILDLKTKLILKIDQKVMSGV